MSDRTETVVVHATWFAAIASTIVGAFANNIVLLGVSIAFATLMWGYSVYWALVLRRLLSAQLYRNQALGAGLIAIGWAFFGGSSMAYGSNGDTCVLCQGLNIPLVAFIVALMMTFYFIDSSVLAARKSDPLYRNTFHWKQLRLVVWPVIAGSLLVLLVLTAVSPSLLSTQGGGSALFVVLNLVPLFGTGGLALLLLPVSGRRSRDQTLRKNLEWVGLFGASFLVFFILLVSTNGSVSVIFSYLLFVVGSYCIYRSTKSLAPLNKLPESVGVAARSPG
jgi:hypothetical protein